MTALCTKLSQNFADYDQFRIHKMSSVLEKLEQLQTDVIFVSRGMTFYYQPVAIFVNKPLKEKIRSLWQHYMAEQKKDLISNNITLTLTSAKFADVGK